MKRITMIFLALIFLASCNKYSVDIAIDNPTENTVLLKIDDLLVEIPPKEVVWVEMAPGERTFTLANDSIIKYNFAKGIYMVNPTFAEYLMFEEIYGFGGITSMPNKVISFYGLEMEGPYDVIRDFVSPVRWDYGPREVLPEMIEIEGSYALVKKILDINEFIELMGSIESYDEEYDENYNLEYEEENYDFE